MRVLGLFVGLARSDDTADDNCPNKIVSSYLGGFRLVAGA